MNETDKNLFGFLWAVRFILAPILAGTIVAMLFIEVLPLPALMLLGGLAGGAVCVVLDIT